MESKEYHKLTKEQAYEGYMKCKENAEKHYNAASYLAKEKLIPMANSHCILATEEAIKGMFLYLKYQKNDVSIEVKGLFQRHSHKHEFARDIYDVLHTQLVKYLTDMHKAIDISFTEEYFAELKKTNEQEAFSQKMGVDAFKASTKNIINLNLKESEKAITKWFNKADKNKSRGFYVDFLNKKWVLPEVITEDDYKLSKFLSWNHISLLKTLQMIEQMNNTKPEENQ